MLSQTAKTVARFDGHTAGQAVFTEPSQGTPFRMRNALWRALGRPQYLHIEMVVSPATEAEYEAAHHG
jgi:hypothetical protein